jgi:hypothetical protein
LDTPIWVDPREATLSVGRFRPAEHRGVIIDGDWDQRASRLDRVEVFAVAMRRWRDGLSWEAAGAYELHMRRVEKAGPQGADGMRTLADVKTKCAQRDRMFETIQRERRLLVHEGFDGVYVHIGRRGQLLFGARGVHRFVAALLSDVEEIPAQLGVVHPGALPVRLQPGRPDEGAPLDGESDV